MQPPGQRPPVLLYHVSPQASTARILANADGDCLYILLAFLEGECCCCFQPVVNAGRMMSLERARLQVLMSPSHAAGTVPGGACATSLCPRQSSGGVPE